MAVDDLGTALAAVVTTLGPARHEVAAVGVTGMAESGAPLRGGRPAAPIIAWHDGRGTETVARLEARFGPDLARWTGRRVGTVSSVAKLGWLLHYGLAVPDRWLGVPELALWLLTGAEATEHSLAARTGAYHVVERAWLGDVCEFVGFPARVFPEVRPAGHPMGAVSAEAARRFGVPAGIPVTVAGHDHLAAGAGLGALSGDLLNSVGTAETVLRRVDAGPDVGRALELDLAVTVWPGGESWCVLASAGRSGLVIRALAAHLGAEPAVLDDLPAVDRGDPADRPSAEPVPLGQGIEIEAGPPAEMWQATLHALARRTAAAAERVAALAGPHDRAVVFGGGSRSRVWIHAKATELGVPVVRCRVPEAAARGAALAAGVAAGWWTAPADGPTTPLDPPHCCAQP